MDTIAGKKYSRKGIIVLCCLVYFVSYFSRKDFAAVMAAMITEGVIGRANAGLVGTMLFIFYGVGQLLSGYLGDRVQPKYLIITGLSVTAMCNALMTVVGEGVMIAVWGVNGLAQAMLWPPIVKILSQYLDHDTYVSANLAVTSAAHVSTVILYVFVPVCLSFMTWSAVFVSAAALSFLAMTVFTVAMRFILPRDSEVSDVMRADIVSGRDCDGGACDGAGDSTETPVCSVTAVPSLISIVRETGMLPLFGSIIAMGFLRDGIESWLPMLYSEAFGKGVSESTLLSMILPVFSIISITVVTLLHRRGVLSNEVDGSAILFGVAVALGVPLAFFVGMDGAFFSVASLVLTALICAMMHGVNFLLISCLPGRFARYGRAATVSGVCNSCVYIGAALSTYGIALLSDLMGWQLTVAVWCIILALGIVFTVLSRGRYKAAVMDNTDH